MKDLIAEFVRIFRGPVVLIAGILFLEFAAVLALSAVAINTALLRYIFGE